MKLLFELGELINLHRMTDKILKKVFLIWYGFVMISTIPIYHFHKYLYFSFWSIIHRNLTPAMWISTSFGVFHCRKKTSDIAYLIPTYEIKTSGYIKNNRGIFIDVGAHIGRYTVMSSKKSKKVLAIEPDRDNYEAIIRNVKANNINNAIILNLAVYNKSAVKRFYSKYIGGTNSLEPKKSKYKFVNCNSLDYITKKCDIKPEQITLIKIDIEGTELNAILGAKNILKKSNAKIIFESLNKSNLNRCKEVLHKFNYSVKQLEMVNYIAKKHK